MPCAKCGAAVGHGKNRCQWCDHPVEPGSATAPTGSSPGACPKCGASGHPIVRAAELSRCLGCEHLWKDETYEARQAAVREHARSIAAASRDVTPDRFNPFISGAILLGLLVLAVLGAYADRRNSRVEIGPLAPLPEGVVFDPIKPRYGSKGGLLSVHASATLTPLAWDQLVRTLDDPAAWHPLGLQFRHHVVTGPQSARAMAWQDGQWATVGKTGEPIVLDARTGPRGIVALRWLHERPEGGSPWKSMCYAVIGTGERQSLAPCTDHLQRPPDLQFAVQIHLDRDERTVYTAIR